MEKPEYKVVWAIDEKEAETRAFCPLAALGFADQAKNLGATVIKIAHHGVIQSLEEFEKTVLRD